MKKTVFVCFVLCLSVLFCACHNAALLPAAKHGEMPADTSSGTTPEPQGTSSLVCGAQFKRIPYRDDGIISRFGGRELLSETSVFALPVCSEEELSYVLSEIQAYAKETGCDFDAQQWIDAYSHAQEKQTVYLLELTAPSGSIRYRLKDVTASKDGDGLEVTIERLVPSVGTDDMASWLVFLCIDGAYSASDPIRISFETVNIGK